MDIILLQVIQALMLPHVQDIYRKYILLCSIQNGFTARYKLRMLDTLFTTESYSD